MNLFIDTEFNSFGGDLISLALVAADGQEFYQALHCAVPHPWVAEHVLPVLEIEPIPYFELQVMLAQFLARFDSVHIIADWPDDIRHFCNLLITGPGMRLPTPPLTMEVLRIDGKSANPHNALADAWGLFEEYHHRTILCPT